MIHPTRPGYRLLQTRLVDGRIAYLYRSGTHHIHWSWTPPVGAT